LRLCAKVMFEYMQITKSTNENGYRNIHICHAGNHDLYCGRVFVQSPNKTDKRRCDEQFNQSP
jgi:hypothetical protein